ncbi:MAG: hypothetical protein HGJ97_15705 [Desulfosporosinus sp.]|nr:hypothetical protein [Desulfosporosinus sp.]
MAFFNKFNVKGRSFEGQISVGKVLEIIKTEWIVRGYLTGSALKKCKKTSVFVELNSRRS